MKSTIEKKLREKFTTGYILVEDRSSLHVGHIEELKNQKETHIHITIKTKEFYGLEPLARHKIIEKPQNKMK